MSNGEFGELLWNLVVEAGSAYKGGLVPSGGGGERPTSFERRNRASVFQAMISDNDHNGQWLLDNIPGATSVGQAINTVSRYGDTEYNAIQERMLSAAASAGKLDATAAGMRAYARKYGISLDETRILDPTYQAGKMAELEVARTGAVETREKVGSLMTRLDTFGKSLKLRDWTDPASIVMARDGLAGIA